VKVDNLISHHDEGVISKRILKKSAKIDQHIDHNKDEYTFELQRSKYIKIDDDYKTANDERATNQARWHGQSDDIKLKLKFCQPIDVDRKFS